MFDFHVRDLVTASDSMPLKDFFAVSNITHELDQQILNVEDGLLFGNYYWDLPGSLSREADQVWGFVLYRHSAPLTGATVVCVWCNSVGIATEEWLCGLAYYGCLCSIRCESVLLLCCVSRCDRYCNVATHSTVS
jgi:hypothetical protein